MAAAKTATKTVTTGGKRAPVVAGQPSAPEGAEGVLLVALVPLKHGGRRHVPGGTFAVAPVEVGPLLDAGLAGVPDSVVADSEE